MTRREKQIEKIDFLLNHLKRVKNNLKKWDKLASKEVELRKISKREVDINWIAMDNIRASHEIHALCAELGFSEVRAKYDDIELNPSAWQSYKYSPRKPTDFNEI